MAKKKSNLLLWGLGIAVVLYGISQMGNPNVVLIPPDGTGLPMDDNTASDAPPTAGNGTPPAPTGGLTWSGQGSNIPQPGQGTQTNPFQLTPGG